MPEAFGRMSYGYFGLLIREMDKQDIRNNFPAAAVQATLCNLNRDPDANPRPFEPWDFMPGFRMKDDTPNRVATPEELSAFFGAVKG